MGPQNITCSGESDDSGDSVKADDLGDYGQFGDSDHSGESHKSADSGEFELSGETADTGESCGCDEYGDYDESNNPSESDVHEFGEYGRNGKTGDFVDSHVNIIISDNLLRPIIF